MATKTVTITNPVGLHARPAAELVNIVKGFSCDCFIINGSNKANAGSIINLLTLGAKEGVELTVQCDGAGDEEACDAIVKFLAEMKD